MKQNNVKVSDHFLETVMDTSHVSELIDKRKEEKESQPDLEGLEKGVCNTDWYTNRRNASVTHGDTLYDKLNILRDLLNEKYSEDMTFFIEVLEEIKFTAWMGDRYYLLGPDHTKSGLVEKVHFSYIEEGEWKNDFNSISFRVV